MISSFHLHSQFLQQACNREAFACLCSWDVRKPRRSRAVWPTRFSSERFLPWDRTDQDRWRVYASAGEVDDDEIDFAVLRITLGIPGFDERQLPRVVAALCISLLFANRYLSPGLSTPSQGRVDALAVFLAAACFAVPALGRRLADARAGRTQASNSLLASGAQLFEISPTVSQSTKQELAWASYTLLRNTGGCSLLIFSTETVWLARGVFASSGAGQGTDKLHQLSKAAAPALTSSKALRSLDSAVYLPDNGAMHQAGISDWKFLPDGTKSVLLQPLLSTQGSSQTEVRNGTQRQMPVLLLASTVPRSLSRRERLWAAAIAAKLAALLPDK